MISISSQFRNSETKSTIKLLLVILPVTGILFGFGLGFITSQFIAAEQGFSIKIVRMLWPFLIPMSVFVWFLLAYFKKVEQL